MRINEQNTLVLTVDDWQAAGLSYKIYEHGRARNQIECTTVGGNGRKAEIVYESLPERYKAPLQKLTNNDPYGYCRTQAIKQLLEPDTAAHLYYTTVRLADGNTIHPDAANKAYQQARWMNLATRLADKDETIDRAVRKSLTSDRWKGFIQGFSSNGVKLPTNYERLMAKLREYNTRNYACLIDGRASNQNASKLSDEQMKLLMRLVSDHRNLDDVMVSKLFNAAMREIGADVTISDRTVGRYRRKHTSLIAGARRGEKEFTHHTIAQVMRSKPTQAGMMASIDGWTVELLFQDTHYNKDNKKKTDYHRRLDLVALVDPFNDFIMGYAVGVENIATIQRAVKNAVDTIYKLTGKYYLLNQVQSDHFGHATLKPWFENVVKYYTPAQVGNSKAKPVESFWRRLNDQYFRLQPNWSGHNIDSRKENQPNMDWIMKHKHLLPTVEQGYEQIVQIVEHHRAEREQEWLESFGALVDSGRMIEITREQYLLNFGTTKPDTNKLTPSGLHFEKDTVRYSYDLLDVAFKSLTWVDWKVIYDTDNMSSVLAVCEDRGLRYLLPEVYKPSMAIMDRKDGDGAHLQAIKVLKAQQTETATEFLEEVYAATERLLPAAKDPRLKMIIAPDGQHKKAIQKIKNVVPIETRDNEPIDWAKKALEDF